MADIRFYLHDNPKRRIADYPRYTLTFGASDTEQSFTVETSSLFYLAVVQVANLTNSVTGTLAIVNGNGDTLFSKASIAENATTLVLPSVNSVDWMIPLTSTMTISFTLSGAPGGTGGTVKITLYGI